MRFPVSMLVVLAATCLIAASIPIAAQAPVTSCGPDDVVPWWPRALAYDGAETLTKAERATAEARLAAIEELARKTPYAKPRGFAVKPWFSIHAIEDRAQLYRYDFWLETKFRCNKNDEAQVHLSVEINPDPMLWSLSDRPEIDERGDAVYAERPRRKAILGSTATFGGFHEENTNTSAFYLLFATADESPVLPLSREEYVRLKIFRHEGANQEKLKALIADLSQTPYERWVADAAARKKQNEELFAVIASSNPAQAAKTRADMEKLEQAEGETLKRADAFEREKNAKVIATMKAIGDAYRAEIAKMTPAERASQAYVVGDDLVPAGAPDAQSFVRKNPAFYRARTSPLEPRAILVSMPNGYKELWPQQEQLFKQFDWTALKKMVNP